MKPIFDYSDGDFCMDMGGGMMMDSDGNLMQDMGGGMAMDMDSGELHIMDCSSSDSFSPWDDEE
jgi:hypothetical protein